ncbi:response regulator transcription factor [Nitrococcus mobilis]|uniref:Two-component system response regulator n=1 Tax=Nitrococcus mobilis Nb-231 TaxID=314278 RepID=A4BNC8_9GAMM|nr:LuxR C-terminal-related transcriptional regulator [Nitrococcus mobilis]EAR22727.1 two-component system response regulator [Nitrococcus mobilis Nb-231]
MLTSDNPTVYVIDSDALIVATLQKLFSSVHIEAEYFNSADACLARIMRCSRGCILADASTPELCVATFQHRLSEDDIELPVIFLSKGSDVATAVDALKHGAADFLEKPFNDQMLLDAVHRAIEIDQVAAADRAARQTLRNRFDALTAREWEVLIPMIKGSSNRMIAGELGLSKKTVEAHRARIMRKTEATNLAELIRIALRIDLLGELTQRPFGRQRKDHPPVGLSSFLPESER